MKTARAHQTAHEHFRLIEPARESTRPVQRHRTKRCVCRQKCAAFEHDGHERLGNIGHLAILRPPESRAHQRRGVIIDAGHQRIEMRNFPGTKRCFVFTNHRDRHSDQFAFRDEHAALAAKRCARKHEIPEKIEHIHSLRRFAAKRCHRRFCTARSGHKTSYCSTEAGFTGIENQPRKAK